MLILKINLNHPDAQTAFSAAAQLNSKLHVLDKRIIIFFLINKRDVYSRNYPMKT